MDGTIKTNKYIQFVQPCPKVEWAGDLKRDQGFIVNEGSDNSDKIMVTVYNPNHGEKTFQAMMTSDQLETVRLSYRKIGALQWSIAQTNIEVQDEDEEGEEGEEGESGEPQDRQFELEDVDFAANYAPDESEYGYISMEWDLNPNQVSEGAYEIKVETRCEALGGPADFDFSSSPILSGVIDLTAPEIYGRPLPLRDAVLIGEEITVLFTESLHCENLPFDMQVIVEETDITLNKNALKVICEGRKISFQFDSINDAIVLGKTFEVTIGRIGATSESHVFDSNGNSMESNIVFEKKFADINLDEAATSFTFTLHNIRCSQETLGSEITEIKSEIVSLLGLEESDRDRIELRQGK